MIRSRWFVAAQAIQEFVPLNEWQIGEVKKAMADADRGDFASDKQVRRSLTRLQKKIEFLAAATVTLCFLFTVGCEGPISVRVESGPSFKLGGRTDLLMFTVFAPQAGKKIANFFDPAGVIWQIQAQDETLAGKSSRDMELVYGRVPSGFTQVEPPPPRTARTPSPGNIYAFWARAKDDRMRTGFFYMRDGGPVPVDIPDLCFESADGRWINNRCGTRDPYQEPPDMEKFVKQHKKSE